MLMDLSWTVETSNDITCLPGLTKGQFAGLFASIVRGEIHIMLSELLFLYHKDVATDNEEEKAIKVEMSPEQIKLRLERLERLLPICFDLFDMIPSLLFEDESGIWASLPFQILLDIQQNVNGVFHDIKQFFDRNDFVATRIFQDNILSEEAYLNSGCNERILERCKMSVVKWSVDDENVLELFE